MTVEALDVILKLWSSEPPYEHKGKFWQFSLKENVNMETQIGFIHKPLQQPHPPIAMPGINRNSYSSEGVGGSVASPRFLLLLLPAMSSQTTGRPISAAVWKRDGRRTDPTGKSPGRSFWPTPPERQSSAPAQTRWGRTSSTSPVLWTRAPAGAF